VVSLVRARPVAARVQRFAAATATFGASVTTAIGVVFFVFVRED
jgi:hypothetical protein